MLRGYYGTIVSARLARANVVIGARSHHPDLLCALWLVGGSETMACCGAGGGPERLVAEVDLGALRRNVSRVRHLVGSAADVMAVVKANAYGHGAVEVARAAIEAGAAALGVATVGEARELRCAGVKVPIYHLPPCAPEEAAEIVALGVVPVLSHIHQARALDAAAKGLGLVAEAHVAVDTGMGRSGVPPSRVRQFVQQVQLLPSIRLTGITTHFPAAESDGPYTRCQIGTFKAAVTAARDAGFSELTRHCANSAGLLLYPDARMDMVRPGLLLYGIVPDMPAGEPPLPDFEPVLTLKTRVLLARAMRAGASVSYGRTHILARDSLVGTLGVGYGDGYPRELSGKGHALVRGRRVPILGRVCMDVTMVDLTDVYGARSGDEAVLIGEQGSERITAVEIARAIDTTEHDVTTRLTGRVGRRFLGGGGP